eukprot:SAG22_NODE_1147_length_5370_cov_3.083855_10_plen_296_part_00
MPPISTCGGSGKGQAKGRHAKGRHAKGRQRAGRQRAGKGQAGRKAGPGIGGQEQGARSKDRQAGRQAGRRDCFSQQNSKRKHGGRQCLTPSPHLQDALLEALRRPARPEELGLTAGRLLARHLLGVAGQHVLGRSAGTHASKHDKQLWASRQYQCAVRCRAVLSSTLSLPRSPARPGPQSMSAIWTSTQHDGASWANSPARPGWSRHPAASAKAAPPPPPCCRPPSRPATRSPAPARPPRPPAPPAVCLASPRADRPKAGRQASRQAGRQAGRQSDDVANDLAPFRRGDGERLVW